MTKKSLQVKYTCFISTVTGENLDKLREKISTMVSGKKAFLPGKVVLSNCVFLEMPGVRREIPRQYRILEEKIQCLGEVLEAPIINLR